MAALTRPLGDAISTIYGADLYLTKKDLKRMKVGDRYEVLCEDALHYMVEVKELHIGGGGGGSSSNSLYGKLHFNRWNRKFDYTGFLHALYIAPMNTFSKGMLNIGTNQYPPSWRTQLRTGAAAEVVEDPVNRRSLKRPVESDDDNNNNREKLPSRSASRVDSSPLAAAPVPSHVAVSAGSKHPPQSSKPRPVVSTSNLSLRSGGSTHRQQQQQSGRGFFKSKSSKVVKGKVRAIRPLLAAPRTRSLMESGRRNTMISLKRGQNVPASSSSSSSSSMVHVDAGIIIEDREEGGTIDDKGSIGMPEQQQQKPPPSSRRLVHNPNPNPSSDTTTSTAVVAPSLGTDAPRNRVGRPSMKQKQQTPLPIPLISRPEAAVLLTDSPNQQPTQLSDHHHQTIDADAASAADPPIPESGVRIKETTSTAAAAGSRRKPKVTFVLTNSYQGNNNNNTTTTTEISSPSRTAPSAAPDRVPAVHPARAAAASDHASLLRTRTCYPAGYLDKPRLFTGSKRRRYSQEEEDDEATLTQSSTTQSSTTQLSQEQSELKTSLETSPPDRSPDDLEASGEAESVPSVSSPSYTSDGRRDPTPVRHRDTLQAINWVAETGLHASRPIFGPVSMLLHHRTVLLDDPSLTAVLEDLLPAQALLSFLVTCRADETYYRRKFKQMKIANAVHLVDDAKQPVDDAKQRVDLSSVLYPYSPSLQLSEDVQLSAMGKTTSSGTGSSSRDWTRQLLVDKLFPPPLHEDDVDESVGRADSLLRSFLCAKVGFHRVVWVEELHPDVPKSYLFFSSSSKEGQGQGPSPPTRPITLYCKTKPAACPIPIVCRYTSTRPPPDYSQLHRLFSETRMQSRVVFNCTLLPRTREDSLLCSMDSLLSGSGDKAVSAVTSLRDGQEKRSSSLVEVVYPSMVEVSSRVTSTARSVPVSMKEEEEELEGKASTSIPSQSSQPIRYNEELLPIPVVTIPESQPGFWFPANASGYRGISALCEDWADELSSHSDDGWFLPLSSLVHPPNSSSCPGVSPLQVGCLSLRNSQPWSARRGDLYESIMEKAPLLVTDASVHPPNCQLFVAFQSREAYLQWKGAVHVFPDYPIDVPPQTWVALRVADVYELRRRTTTIRATTATTTTTEGISSSSFHLIRRGDALVWLPPQSDDLGVEKQPPVDQPLMESMVSTSDDLHIDEEASVARVDTIDVEPAVLLCDPNPSEINPIDRAVRCLDIDRIAQTHREAIDAFRQMQPALEARDVRAPHLLLLLSAQLELAEATKMMLDHLHLQRHEQ